MKAVPTNISFPKLEEDVLSFWKSEDIFQKSTSADRKTTADGQDKQRPSYVFYDGPPFATGLPHYGHLLAGTIKDVVGRFFTMKGYHVDRRFGWDCHGVPVEFEIQKSLDLHGAKAIREFGVDKFNEECRSIVLRYTKEWEKFVTRSGRWVDFDRQYRTMDLNYMESIWSVVKSLWDKDLVYEGLKCVPYSWAINTPLSNFEANLNYKTVQDPAVTVRAIFDEAAKSRIVPGEFNDFKFVAYVWTTTPWTLPSNMGLAVGADIDYALVVNESEGEIVAVAKELIAQHFTEFDSENPSEGSQRIVKEFKGSELEGLSYEQFFGFLEEYRKDGAFKVFCGEFVTAEEGTGVVHLASFGEEDVGVFLENNIPVIDPVDEDGNFGPKIKEFEGLNIKEADSQIIKSLKSASKLVKHDTIEHSYPFCWRTDTPLMYKPVSSWFVKVEQFKDRLIKNNSEIHWVPDHLRQGRFGKWLENARDWAISRNRFWGCPIPIWRCEETGETCCIGSVAELEEKTGEKIEDLHSHFIDHLTFPTADGKHTMKRVPEVLDCWFESGAMPYAQAHYPFENKETFEENFPADFIAEGLDQTRGWFYTLLVLSTALFDRPAFKNVIVNGILLAEDGKKMSKSLKNYPPPDEVMNELGADAMRLYLLSSAATRAEELRFSKSGVKNVVRQTILPLWNAYNFLVTYALVDGWTPEQKSTEQSTNVLDKWILSKTASLIEGVDEALSDYRLYAAIQPVLDYVDQLTNWYIRLNRRRFWAGDTAEEKADKIQAYSTLHTVLCAFVRVLSPLAPFVTEEIYKNLVSSLDSKQESVHLTSFPKLDELAGAEIDPSLEKAMELFEQVILLGRSVRNDQGLKVRQPLEDITIVYADKAELDNLKVLDGYIREELNVKAVNYEHQEESYVNLEALLNTKKLGKVLGPKLGSKGMKELRNAVQALDTSQLRELESGKPLTLAGVEISGDDVLVKRTCKDGLDAAASSGQVTVILNTVLNEELELEGLSREFVNRVQKARKDADLNVQDRIALHYVTDSEKLSKALEQHASYISKETLSKELGLAKDTDALSSMSHTEEQDIEGVSVTIGFSVV